MKNLRTSLLSLVIVSLVMVAFTPDGGDNPTTDQYIVIAWNDLGMHCANLEFANMCILPPFNNQKVHVIRKGDQTRPPLVVPASSGVNVTYEIPGNTYSVGKTNFWSYSQHLFGATLAPNIGLTGFGLSGTMLKNDSINYHYVEGIPITAFPDATLTTENPFQLTLIKAFSSSGQLLASTQSVIPVSHEINCVSSGCHSSELSILQHHDQVPGFNIADKPILCANCHSDNALGMPGQPDVDPFSQVIHMKHGEFIKTGTSADCYKCHPGPNTQCWRDVMHTTTGAITKCQNCHGSVFNVGKTIENGREPWLEEPSCGSSNCHGPQYAEEPGKLFRNSKGHGGLYCSTCHNSPHAILPTSQPADNVQNIALQGFAGTLSECSVCHGYTPAGNGPHGIPAIKVVQNQTVNSGQSTCFNATQTITVAGNGTTFNVLSGGTATFVSGRLISFLPGTLVSSGGYLHGYITTKGRYCNNPLPPMAPVQTSADAMNGPDDSDVELFRVYPNPTSGMLNIVFKHQTDAASALLSVYNNMGSEVLVPGKINPELPAFSLEKEPAGIYILRITTNSGKSGTVKIIRQ